jgi:outer membrane autotransporter protein
MHTPTVRGETVFGPGSAQYSTAGNQIGGYDVTYVVPTGEAGIFGEGTIFANNDFTVRGGGSLIIELDIQVGGNFITEISRLTLGGNVNVAGTASLSGVLGFANDQAPEPNASYTILTAGKGIIGRFSRLDTLYTRQPGSLLAYAIKYESNAVFVETVQNEFKNSLSVFTLTGNQNATAGALDSAISDPRQDAVHAYLNARGIQAVPGLLDQIAPEELGAIYSIGSARMNGVVNSLQNRFAEIRASRQDASTVARATLPPSTSAKSTHDAPVLTPPPKQRHGVFTTASGDFSKIGNTADANGYDTESGTILAGYDARIDDSLTVGVLVGYSHSESDLHGNGGIDADGCNAALYAQYVRNDWFLESMIGGGYYSYDTDREALNGTASGDTDGGSCDGYLSIGKDLRSGSLTVTPFASLLYVRTGIDEYDETGSLQPLQMESQAADSLRSRLGLRASKAFSKGACVITPYASAEWQYELLDDAPSVNYSFANGAGGTATATGPETGQHSLLAGAGLQVAWERYACYLSYQADLGRENYENQMVLAGFRMSW